MIFFINIFFKIGKVLDSSDLKFKLVTSIGCELSKNPLDNLPNEICIIIFSFFTKKDMGRAAQVKFLFSFNIIIFLLIKVCWQWNAFTKDESLKRIVEDGYVSCDNCRNTIGKESYIICRVRRKEIIIFFKNQIRNSD
jgi:hypothetical protein